MPVWSRFAIFQSLSLESVNNKYKSFCCEPQLSVFLISKEAAVVMLAGEG